MGISNRSVLVSDGGGRTIGAGAGNGLSDYNKLKALGQNIAKNTGLTAQLNQVKQNAQQFHDNNKRVQQPQTSGYTAQEAPSYSGGSSVSTTPSYNDEIINKIKSLLNEGKASADNLINSQYSQALENAKNQERLDSEKANLRRATLQRRMDEMYGDSVTGKGLSNKVKADSVWYNDIANIQRDLANRNTTALQEKNRGLENNARTLAQGWYNYVLPVYEGRQRFDDSLKNDIQKFMLSQQLYG